MTRIHLAAVLLLAVFALAPHPVQADDGSYVLNVVLRGVDASRDGSLRCGLYGGKQGFPSDPAGALAHHDTQLSQPRCRFVLPKAGTYALAVLHDENGNKRLDKTLIGFPKEGWGTSNNVRPRMRAPTFNESKFDVTQSSTTIFVNLNY